MSTATASLTPTRRVSLPFALRLDAVVSAANGVAYLALAGALDSVLGLDAAFLRGVGACFIVFALGVELTARRPRPLPVTAIVEGNLLYAVASVAMAVFAWGSPTTAGTVWIALQGLTVGGFAALQHHARR